MWEVWPSYKNRVKTLDFEGIIMYELTQTEFEELWEAIALLYEKYGKNDDLPRLEFLLYHYIGIDWRKKERKRRDPNE